MLLMLCFAFGSLGEQKDIETTQRWGFASDLSCLPLAHTVSLCILGEGAFPLGKYNPEPRSSLVDYPVWATHLPPWLGTLCSEQPAQLYPATQNQEGPGCFLSATRSSTDSPQRIQGTYMVQC